MRFAGVVRVAVHKVILEEFCILLRRKNRAEAVEVVLSDILTLLARVSLHGFFGFLAVAAALCELLALGLIEHVDFALLVSRKFKARKVECHHVALSGADLSAVGRTYCGRIADLDLA